MGEKEVAVDVRDVPVYLGADLTCDECEVEWPVGELVRYTEVLRRKKVIVDGFLYCPACGNVVTLGNA